jgi:hypothetical protein
MRRGLVAAAQHYAANTASLEAAACLLEAGGSMQVRSVFFYTFPTCTHAQISNERKVGRLRTNGEVHSG